MAHPNPIIRRALERGGSSGGTVGDISGGTGATVSSRPGGRGTTSRSVTFRDTSGKVVTATGKGSAADVIEQHNIQVKAQQEQEQAQRERAVFAEGRRRAQQKIGVVTSVIRKGDEITFVGLRGEKFTVQKEGLTFTGRERFGGIPSKERPSEFRRSFPIAQQSARRVGEEVMESLWRKRHPPPVSVDPITGEQTQEVREYTPTPEGLISEFKPTKEQRFKRFLREREGTFKGILLGSGYAGYRFGKGYVLGATALFRPKFYTEELPEMVRMGGKIVTGKGVPEIGMQIMQDPASLFEMGGFMKGFGKVSKPITTKATTGFKEYYARTSAKAAARKRAGRFTFDIFGDQYQVLDKFGDPIITKPDIPFATRMFRSKGAGIRGAKRRVSKAELRKRTFGQAYDRKFFVDAQKQMVGFRKKGVTVRRGVDRIIVEAKTPRGTTLAEFGKPLRIKPTVISRAKFRQTLEFPTRETPMRITKELIIYERGGTQIPSKLQLRRERILKRREKVREFFGEEQRPKTIEFQTGLGKKPMLELMESKLKPSLKDAFRKRQPIPTPRDITRLPPSRLQQVTKPLPKPKVEILPQDIFGKGAPSRKGFRKGMYQRMRKELGPSRTKSFARVYGEPFAGITSVLEGAYGKPRSGDLFGRKDTGGRIAPIRTTLQETLRKRKKLELGFDEEFYAPDVDLGKELGIEGIQRGRTITTPRLGQETPQITSTIQFQAEKPVTGVRPLSDLKLRQFAIPKTRIDVLPISITGITPAVAQRQKQAQAQEVIPILDVPFPFPSVPITPTRPSPYKAPEIGVPFRPPRYTPPYRPPPTTPRRPTRQPEPGPPPPLLRIHRLIPFDDPFKIKPIMRKGKVRKKRFRYQPSLVAVSEGIFGKRPQILTGLFVRPL